MHKELKKAIIAWLFDNEKLFNITNGATEHFRPYIYTDKGDFLIGGEDVYEFIIKADDLLFNTPKP